MNFFGGAGGKRLFFSDFCRPQVDIFWHRLLRLKLSRESKGTPRFPWPENASHRAHIDACHRLKVNHIKRDRWSVNIFQRDLLGIPHFGSTIPLDWPGGLFTPHKKLETWQAPKVITYRQVSVPNSGGFWVAFSKIRLDAQFHKRDCNFRPNVFVFFGFCSNFGCYVDFNQA